MKMTSSIQVKPCRDGDEIMVTIPNYWARDIDLPAALQKLRAEGGIIGKYWRIHSCHPTARVNEVGLICHPKGHPNIMLLESNPKD